MEVDVVERAAAPCTAISAAVSPRADLPLDVVAPVEEGRPGMHGRLALALLLVVPLLAPAAASGAVPRERQIAKVQTITSSAGALVRVTMRAPLKGRIAVRFTRRSGAKGSTRRSTVIHGRKRTDFVFAGDARSLARVIVRTTPRGDRVTRRLKRVKDDCAALTKLARTLRPLRKGRPAIKRRLSAITRRRNACGGATLPIVPGPTPPPGPGPGPPVFTGPGRRLHARPRRDPRGPGQRSDRPDVHRRLAGQRAHRPGLELRRRHPGERPGRPPHVRATGPLHGPPHRPELPRAVQRLRPRAVRARPRDRDVRRRRRRLPRAQA